MSAAIRQAPPDPFLRHGRDYRIAGAGRHGRLGAMEKEMRFKPRLFLALSLAFCAVPNGEAAWWHDRIYDLCMATAGDDDWTCEDRLTALPGDAEAAA